MTEVAKKYLWVGLLFPISAFGLYLSSLTSLSFTPDLPWAAQQSETRFEVNFIKAHELKDWLASGRISFLVDARRPQEYANGHVPTAVSAHRYQSSVAGGGEELCHLIVFYCNGPAWSQSDPCVRAIVQELQKGSNQVYWFKGGMRAWRAQGYPVMSSSSL